MASAQRRRSRRVFCELVWSLHGSRD